MENIFCPFAKGPCKSECLFNNGCFDLGNADNCDLKDAVLTIRSLGEHGSQIDKRLSAIEDNTSSDQTESYGIKSVLRDIEGLIKQSKT